MTEALPEQMPAWRKANGELVFGEIDTPAVPPGYALVRVMATTVSHGEARYLPSLPDGRVPGLDIAGIVVRAADGGPPEGARVIAMTAMRGGGWARFAAVPATDLGVIPDSVDWPQAACLANAGLTALYAVRTGGSLLGTRVLVTGASGAVGRYAAQIAQQGGAQVTGTVSRPERAAAIANLGLAEVSVALDVSGPFDAVIDTVGGEVLAHALQCVAPDAVVVALAGGGKPQEWKQPAAIPFGWELTAPGARIESVNVAHIVDRNPNVGRDLQVLGGLAAKGLVEPEIARVVDWREADTMIARFDDIKGRIVLLIDG